MYDRFVWDIGGPLIRPPHTKDSNEAITKIINSTLVFIKSLFALNFNHEYCLSVFVFFFFLSFLITVLMLIDNGNL